jgi:hypothetical protein
VVPRLLGKRQGQRTDLGKFLPKLPAGKTTEIAASLRDDVVGVQADPFTSRKAVVSITGLIAGACFCGGGSHRLADNLNRWAS